MGKKKCLDLSEVYDEQKGICRAPSDNVPKDSSRGNQFTQGQMQGSQDSSGNDEGSGALDWLQGGLDIAGLIPGIGEIADGANALIYTARGDYTNAGLSAAAMIPFAGWGATGAKGAIKAKRALNATDVATDGARALTKGTVKALDGIGTKISQKQMRHVKGRKEWLQRGQGSYVGSVDEAQAVLDAAHGGAAKVLGRTSQGHVVVRYDGVTGFNNNPAAGFIDQPTNVFMIKGTAKPSVVPTSPAWTPK